MSIVKMTTILVVEDDPGHARLIEKNLRSANLANPIKLIGGGREAIDYLFGQGQYQGQERDTPLLVLLDLNMPDLDGRQVLGRIKADERTRHIPVIVLTTTEEEYEVKRCYELGCNVFISKPVDYGAFSAAVRSLGLCLAVVAVPS